MTWPPRVDDLTLRQRNLLELAEHAEAYVQQELAGNNGQMKHSARAGGDSQQFAGEQYRTQPSAGSGTSLSKKYYS